jgi:hypothetical protein
MASVDSYNNINPVLLLAPGTITTTVTTNAVNMQGYESLTFLIQTGVGTDGTFTLSFQDSPDESTWFNIYVTTSSGTTTNGYFGGNYPVVPPLLAYTTSSYVTAVNQVVYTSSLPGPFVGTTTAWNSQVFKVGYVGYQPYVRAILTESAATDGMPFAILAEQGCPHFAPTPQTPNP